MRLFPKIRARRHPALMGLLIALAIVLRLVGPMAAAGGLPEHDGYVAICTGSEIVYIPIAEAGFDPLPGEKAPAPKSDPCPWFGQLHAALLPDNPALPLRAPRVVPVDPPAAETFAYSSFPRSFQARAPPVRIV